MIAARMTRIGRIYADFLLPAAKVFRPQIAQIFTNWRSPRLCQRSFAQTKFVPQFVKICAICGCLHHAAGGIKIRVNPLHPCHPRCYHVAFVFISPSTNSTNHPPTSVHSHPSHSATNPPNPASSHAASGFFPQSYPQPPDDTP